MYQELLQICRDDLQNPWIRQLLLSIFEDPEIARDFQRSPAAKTHHHAWVGGLLEHVLGLCYLAKSVLRHYPQIDLDLVLTGMMLHDLGKIEEIRSEGAFEYTSRGQLIGHLIISVEILLKKAAHIPNFPPKVLGHIEHILLSHHGRLEYGSPKLPMTLEALVVHHLDNMDSKIQGFCDIMNRDSQNDSAWTSMTPLFGSPLYKRAREDLEESLQFQAPASPAKKPHKEPKEKAPNKSHQKPLTSNLGEILQKSLEEKP
jgi:3'-5' exoribonuclease